MPRRANVFRLRDLLREVLELYPQTYKCDTFSLEYAHMDAQDWKDLRQRIEAELDD